MFGQVESLNVSVAAALCLYETRRQRAAQGGAGGEEGGRWRKQENRDRCADGALRAFRRPPCAEDAPPPASLPASPQSSH